MSWSVDGLQAAIKAWATSGTPMSPAEYSALVYEWARDLRDVGPFEPNYATLVYLDDSDPAAAEVVHVLDGSRLDPVMIQMVANEATRRVAVVYVGRGPSEPPAG